MTAKIGMLSQQSRSHRKIHPMCKFLGSLFKRTSAQTSKAHLILKYSPPNPNGIPPDYGNLEACAEGQKVGCATFCAAQGCVFTLEKIEVFGDKKGKGYGTQMIECLISEAKKLNCTKFVFQGVADENTGAIKLYQRFGARQGAVRGTGKHDYEIDPL